MEISLEKVQPRGDESFVLLYSKASTFPSFFHYISIECALKISGLQTTGRASGLGLSPDLSLDVHDLRFPLAHDVRS